MDVETTVKRQGTEARRHEGTEGHGELRARAGRGDVNAGWTPAAWAERLEQMAGRCEALQPELAASYRQWAAKVKAKISNGG